MLYIPYPEVKEQCTNILTSVGCTDTQAEHLAEIFVNNSLEGVYSHGLNRFPRFIHNIRDRYVDIHANPERISGLGGLEVWDGHLGAGPLCAETCMDRAIELSKSHGIGCVSIRNSNHWMRAGRYGWQAANAGMIGMCWTNTLPNMPIWGATDSRIGNNPIVIAVPRKNGNIVMDMSMSQFAYGKMEVAALNNELMPFDAGYDEYDNLTRNPKEVLKSQRIMPTGYWKGSSMAMVLDLAASAMSLGRTTAYIGKVGGEERGLTQVFIAINFRAIVDEAQADSILNDSIEYTLASAPIEGVKIRYPGENVLSTKEKNMKHGVPINEKTWDIIQNL